MTVLKFEVLFSAAVDAVIVPVCAVEQEEAGRGHDDQDNIRPSVELVVLHHTLLASQEPLPRLHHAPPMYNQ